MTFSGVPWHSCNVVDWGRSKSAKAEEEKEAVQRTAEQRALRNATKILEFMKANDGEVPVEEMGIFSMEEVNAIVAVAKELARQEAEAVKRERTRVAALVDGRQKNMSLTKLTEDENDAAQKVAEAKKLTEYKSQREAEGKEMERTYVLNMCAKAQEKWDQLDVDKHDELDGDEVPTVIRGTIMLSTSLSSPLSNRH